jgi:O-antigen ligase
MLAVGTLEACIGALQWIKGPAVYVIGTLGGHNVFSAYMTFIMLLMVGVTLETRRADVRLAGVAATAVMLYSIIFTFSRMAYISLLVSFLAFGLMPISRRKRIAIPAASVAITLVTLALVPVSVLERMRGILHTATGQQLALSFKFRLAMWRNALADFASSPIIGTGSSGAPLKDNFFAKAASEAGILGLGALLVLIYLILRASWRSIAEAPQDDFMRGIVVGFFPAAIGTLIVFNLAGDFITLNKFIGVFWIVLALIMRYRDAASTARPAS